MPYQSIYSGKNATLPSGKTNPFADHYQPGQYLVKNQPKPKPDDAAAPKADTLPTVKVPKATLPATKPSKSLLGTIATYAKAAVTSPVGTIKDINNGERIKSVNNGALIVERKPVSYTSKISKEQQKNLPPGTKGQLDHTLSLEIGGTNAKSNLKLMPKEQDQGNSSVENYLGAQLKANKINAQQAKQLMLDYKAGKVSAQDTVDRASKMPKGKSLLSKVGGTVKSLGSAAIAGERVFATGVARDLPGGTNDLKANVKASEQATKNIQEAQKQVKAGKLKPEAAKKIIESNAEAAGMTTKDTAAIIKSMPTKGQIALGAASTAADIATAGTLPALKGTNLTAKVIRGSTKAGEFGTAGALNASAAGGDKKQVAESFVAGAALPGIFKLAGKGGSKAVENITGGQATKDLIANTKTRSLLDLADKAPDSKVAAQVATPDVTAEKALNTIMSKIRTPGKVTQDIKAEAEAAATKQVETEKAVATNTKLDNQIELINAKKADGKFTNVDKVKVQQLEKQKVPVADTKPSVSSTKAVENVSTKKVSNLKQEALKHKSADEFVKAQEPVYHGSPVPLKEFDNKRGAFFTNNYEDATGFAGTPDNVYEGYANFKKPLIIDAKGAKWDDLKTKFGKSTMDVIANAKKAGYDGVTFKNIVDNAMDTEGLGESTIHYAMNPKEGFVNESQLTDLYHQAHAEATKPPKLSTRKETELKPSMPEPTNVPIKEPEIKQPEIGQSKLAASTEQKAIDKKLTAGFEGKPEYAKVDTKDQAKAALELHKTDPARAERIALGKELPPEGVLPESVYVAVENHALQTGNVDLLRKLVTEGNLSSEATGMGQRIRMLGERDPDSAVTAMRKLVETRKAAAEKKLGKPVTKAVSDEVKQIRAAKPKVEKESWGSFVESLKC